MADGTSGSVTLLTAAANGDGATINVPRFAHAHESHLRTLFVWGTFDSATVKFQISPDNTNWFDVPNADAITAVATMNVEFRAPFMRGTVASGLGSEAINMKVL